MKKVILIALMVTTACVVALYMNRPKSPAAVASETETAVAPAAEAAPPEKAIPVKAVSQAREADGDTGGSRSLPSAAPTSSSAQATFDAARVRQNVDVLVSPQATFGEKHEAWKQLQASGKLDAAIQDLEQRMVNDPRAAEYPAALGQAYLHKCATLQDIREQGILGMQADKVFDAALALDPSNWEARFTKAVAMSYWPAVLNKGEEVVQQFQTLIQQQEAQAPQPQFAETYVWLGDQYQRAGQGDQARAAWKRGLALFPSHAALQSKLASQP